MWREGRHVHPSSRSCSVSTFSFSHNCCSCCSSKADVVCHLESSSLHLSVMMLGLPFPAQETLFYCDEVANFFDCSSLVPDRPFAADVAAQVKTIMSLIFVIDFALVSHVVYFTFFGQGRLSLSFKFCSVMRCLFPATAFSFCSFCSFLYFQSFLYSFTRVCRKNLSSCTACTIPSLDMASVEAQSVSFLHATKPNRVLDLNSSA